MGAILKTIEEEIYKYKGLTIERLDAIYQDDTWTLGAHARRSWKIEGFEANVNTIEGIQYLTYYNIPASKGGELLVLKDFKPEIEWWINNNSPGIKDEIAALRKFAQGDYEEKEWDV